MGNGRVIGGNGRGPGLPNPGDGCQYAFHALAGQESNVGRRLDFLLQEMFREVSTIGSKARDAPIAHAVVEAKGLLEKMREQVQNVE